MRQQSKDELVEQTFIAAKIGLLLVGVGMGASAALFMLIVAFNMAWRLVQSCPIL